MKRLIYLSVCVSLMSFVIIACSKKTKDDSDVAVGNPADREAMLIHIADSIIIPGYADFKLKLDDMRSKGDAFRSAPSTATLVAFRQAWADAYIAWEKVELFDVGPAYNVDLRSYMNIYPVNTTSINGNISNGNANLDGGAYNTQGFPALDYLLNGLATSDDDIVAFYTTDANAAKRLAYLLKLTDQMNVKFSSVQDEWLSTYRATFTANTGTDDSAPLSLMINGYVYQYEHFIRTGKFGIPSGVVSGVTIPEDVEAYFKKDLSLQLAKAAHQACVDLFNGKSFKKGVEGPSFKSYLNSLGAKDSQSGQPLTNIVNQQFNKVEGKLNVLSDNLSSEVQNNNTAMINVYSEMQKTVRLIKVDMPSAMAVNITFSDGDGD